jgi:hypothetical protein
LATQLAETFLNTDRLRQVLDQLPESVREFYVQMLFNFRLPRFQDEKPPWLFIKELDLSIEQNYDVLRSSGLGMSIEDRFAVPGELYPVLPPLFLPLFPEFFQDPPQGEVLEAEPLRLIGQLQQLLGLFRVETPALRPALKWLRPGGYRQLSGIVPTPEAVARIQERERREALQINLMAPEPFLPASTLERWSAALSDTPERVEFLYRLLVEVGVLRPGTPVHVEPKNAERFMALAPGRQLYELFNALISVDWQAFLPRWRQGDVQVQWQNRPYREFWGLDRHWSGATYLLRDFVLTLLEFSPHDRWLSLEMIQDLLLKVFSATEQMFDRHRISFLVKGGGVEGFLRMYLKDLLRGPLHALGLVDLALDNRQQIAAFRLRHLQDFMWRRNCTLPLPETAWHDVKLRWAAEDEVLLTPPVSIPLLRQLQGWARPQGAVEGALRYQLDPKRLHAAFEAGETPETLAAAWEAGGGQSTERLRAWWERWWSRYGHLRLYPAQAVLEVKDEFALHELQVAVPELQAALTGMVTPRVALLRRETVPTLVSKMEAKGYMPKVVGRQADKEERG